MVMLTLAGLSTYHPSPAFDGRTAIHVREDSHWFIRPRLLGTVGVSSTPLPDEDRLGKQQSSSCSSEKKSRFDL
jgi:hypothetical protein